MSKYYIDVEVIITRRLYLSGDCNIDNIKELLADGDTDISEEDGFIESEFIYESEVIHEEIDEATGVLQPVYIALCENGKPIYTPYPL